MRGAIAYVGADKQIHLIGADGTGDRQLTLSPGSNPLLWGQPGLRPTSHTWPGWSPDGQRLICFELPDGEDLSDPVRVQVLDVDGLRQQELLSISGRLPVYAAWSPTGDGALILSQEQDHLSLGWVALDRPGELRLIEEGAPLFFSWHPHPGRVLIHVGEVHRGAGPRGRLVVRDVRGRQPDELLPQHPGNYCVPIPAGDHLVQVDTSTPDRPGEVNRLLRTRLDGSEPRALLEFSGLGAIVPAPERGAVIFSAAPDGESTPYRGATLIPLDGGGPRRLMDQDCLAFFWSPIGALVYARVLPEANCLSWSCVLPGGEPRELARFWPSREMLFYLHFFDQFSRSHSLLSPDGSTLVFCGRLLGGGDALPGRPGSDGEGSRVLLADIVSGELRAIARGSSACFSPVSR